MLKYANARRTVFSRMSGKARGGASRFKRGAPPRFGVWRCVAVEGDQGPIVMSGLVSPLSTVDGTNPV